MVDLSDDQVYCTNCETIFVKSDGFEDCPTSELADRVSALEETLDEALGQVDGLFGGLLTGDDS
jgi:hypothetical protein